MENKRLLRTLILCPPVMIETWQREIAAHSKVGHLTLPLVGPGSKRLLFMRTHAAERPIVITNYETLLMQDVFLAIKEWEPEVLVCDESQRIKTFNSKRAKKAALLADKTKHNYLLSGTPVTNSQMDLWGQFRVLDRGETFGTNFYAFRARYFRDKNAGMPSQKHFPNWVPIPGADEELNRLIYKKGIRVQKSECLDLPPLVKKKVFIELSKEQRRIYDEMRKEFVTYIDEKAVTAQMAITKALRLQQIASGYAKTETGEEIEIKDNPRIEALRELLEDIGPDHKVIIWAHFRANQSAVSKVVDDLGRSFTMLTGSQTQEEKQEAIDALQSGAVSTIIANQAAGGVGVTLTAATYAIFYSRSFSLEADLQAEARNYRGGSEVHEKITRIDIIAKNTIDEMVASALEEKQDIAARIVDGKF